MNRRDVRIGNFVYHSLLVYLGRGEVISHATECIQGARGYRDVPAFKIRWENPKHTKDEKGINICEARELRKTPNKKKIELLNSLFKQTGKEGFEVS